ncbi:MAG: M1 family metallopeptidase [Anaerolineae bacterium]
MLRRRLAPLIVLSMVLLITACRARPASIPTPQPTPTPQPAATIASATVDAPRPDSADTLPASSLFTWAWEDRTPFEHGVVMGAQVALAQQPAASVYHLELHLADSLTALTGHEEVHYTNAETEPLDDLALRLFPNLLGGSMTVHSVQVNGQAAASRLAQQDSVLFVPMSPPLRPGQSVVLALDFAVTIPTDAASSNYGIFAYTNDILALAHAYPMVAVYDEEGWNIEIAPQEGDIVYADASYYLVRIHAPAQLVIVSAGTRLDEVQTATGQTITVAAGPARDFYLAASAAYAEAVSVQAGETLVRSYALPGEQASAQEVADIAAQALAFFNEQFGPYPYRELDFAATPTLALGVEYPGMIVMNEVIDAERSPQILESTVVHEVAHQWFYNLVGNDQVDEPWLDESLSQYATLLYYRQVYGKAGETGFRRSLERAWGEFDNEPIPIGASVAAYADGGEYAGTYVAIIYGRGALFFEALSEAMGEATFTAFLREYVQRKAWGISSTADFRALAEQQCDCDLGPLFTEWVY